MDISTKAPQFHLLALPCLNSQRICVYPLIRRHICRLECICQNVEYRRLINYREEGDCRNYLFEDITNFSLNFGLGFGWRSLMWV